jgi:uncharacterized membrane protein
MKLSPEAKHYIVLSLIILCGVIMIASPHFPNSQASEQKNNNAFLALTVIGVFVIIPPLIWIFIIFRNTTYQDIKNYLKNRKYHKLASFREV